MIEHVGVGPVELLALHALGGGADAEAAALAIVEERGEDARRVEARQAEPVDGAVGADERDRAQVADDAVVLDARIAHDVRDAPSVTSVNA